jgi:hypothetical protein
VFAVDPQSIALHPGSLGGREILFCERYSVLHE